MGGVVAYEMAQQLQAQGQEVGLVVLLDSGRPTPKTTSKRGWRPGPSIVGISRRVAHHSGNLMQLSPREQIRYVKEGAKLKLDKRERIPTDSTVRQANKRASRRYVPKPYSGPIALMWASDRPERCPDPRLGWGDLAPGLEVHTVPGDHITMLAEPHVQVLAERLNACLDAAQTQASTTVPS